MLKLAPLKEAQGFIDDLRERYYFARGVEAVMVDDALGRELAEPISSKKESTEYDVSTMDGYALNSGDDYPLKIMGDVHAGEEDIPKLEAGTAVWIATGARLPERANAVLKVEDSEVRDGELFGPKLEEWRYVIRRGTDYARDEKILEVRTRIGPHIIAILHNLGVSKVRVFKKIKVGVYSTGDEIFKGLIHDSNGPMITAFLKEWGCDVEYLGAIPDDFGRTKQILREAVRYDVIVTSGGVSVGRKDFVIKAIEDVGEVLLHKVRTRPGKPVVVGVIEGTPVFALPGKPTGAFVAVELNLRRYFLGDTPRPKVLCECTKEINLPKGRDKLDATYVTFAHIRGGKAYPIGYGGSSIQLFSSKSEYGVSIVAASQRAMVADGYILTNKKINEGETVEVNLF